MVPPRATRNPLVSVERVGRLRAGSRNRWVGRASDAETGRHTTCQLAPGVGRRSLPAPQPHDRLDGSSAPLPQVELPVAQRISIQVSLTASGVRQQRVMARAGRR
jgi:hypothetical protein